MQTQLITEALKRSFPQGRKQVEAHVVFNALADLAPEFKYAPERWSLFVDLLTAAEVEDLIALPTRAGDGWDHSVCPPRPKWIRLPRAEEPRRKFNHHAFPWNPALSFLAKERSLPNGIQEAALAVQSFFAEGGISKPVVPIKERSFQIFRDEKRLETLQHAATLFGPGKLTLEQLRCYVVEPKPVCEQFEHGSGIIVLENEATFDSFCRLSRHKPTYKLVVYGRGNEILKCAAYLQREAERVGTGEIWYFGDVDQRGLEIPFYLNQLMTNTKILAFQQGYDALLRTMMPTTGIIPAICGWLPEGIAAKAANILTRSQHIPQEAFGWEQIASAYNLDATLK